jgi:hypothetical protein
VTCQIDLIYKKFQEELIIYVPLKRCGLHRKPHIQQFFYSYVSSLLQGRWEGFMKYATEMGSNAMMYVPNYIKTGSGIQKLVGGIQTYSHINNIAIS